MDPCTTTASTTTTTTTTTTTPTTTTATSTTSTAPSTTTAVPLKTTVTTTTTTAATSAGTTTTSSEAPVTTTAESNMTVGACLTVSGARPGEECVFPFRLQGRTYWTCTRAGGFSQPWCSTATDAAGNHLHGRWGDSGQDCPTSSSASSCPTRSGPGYPAPCVFPFRFGGVVYTSCARAGYRRPWCSTATDQAGNHQQGSWANCAW